MALVKYATFEVLAAVLHRPGASALRTAHRATFSYEPRPGFLYVRSRAISSRTNDNYDTFPGPEIAASYRSFVGKPVFVNHHNTDVRRLRGVNIDAALHRDTNPDGTPDVWAEVLMEVDAIRFPRLAQAIIRREIERTSMGCNVEWSRCTFCGNRAETPVEYCRHVASLKGARIIRRTAGQRESVLVTEQCHGLSFFENSLLVEPPADPTAFVLDVDTRGLRPEATRQVPVRAVASLAPTEAAGPHHADPSQHPWFAEHPLSADNIVAHWQRATPEDKDQGGRWYSDAHLVAKAIAGGDAHKGAGVLAAYSPQASWPVNMFNAARSLHDGRALGGKGSGVYATASMAAQAQAIMDGGRHEQVLRGPKIQDFAHLIEHGGDQDPSVPHVVIDRHALSVAAGRRLHDAETATAPVATRHYYGHVVDTYRDAARQISALEGHPVAPHQVQATTWLVRQRENAQEDAAMQGDERARGTGRTRSRQRAQEQWEEYRHHYFPKLEGPGYHALLRVRALRRRLSGVEQVAPLPVDTLRPEACPICGDQDSFNGQSCQVCGYTVPPEQLQDPDLDAAVNADEAKDADLPPAGRPPLSFGATHRRNGVDGMAKPRSRSGAPPPHNAAAAQRNRLLAALASQQNQITRLSNALATLVQLAGAGGHPKLAFLARSDVVDGAPVAQPATGEPDEQGILGDPEFQAGAAEGVSDFEGGEAALVSGERLARFEGASPAWQLGWGAGYDHAQRLARRTAADESGNPVATSSDQARKPAATDDPTSEGAVPAAANRGVTPAAATTVDTTNVAGGADPFNDLVDVTQVAPGADGVPSPGDAHVRYDIDSSPPASGTAFSLGDGGWKGGSRTADPRARIYACLRLARLRRATGQSDVDEVILAQQIDDGPLPDEGIAVETAALSGVLTARGRGGQQRVAAGRGLVPQPPAGARRVPSLAGPGTLRTVAAQGAPRDEEFLDLPPG